MQMQMRCGYALMIVIAAMAQPLASYNAQQRQASAGSPGRRALPYVIAASARLQSPDLIDVFGVTNLPTGSVLWVSVNDFIGENATELSEETKLTVESSGLFRLGVRARPNATFTANLTVRILFAPWLQPA